eukprot:8834057-Pyramimonas_sp.AAC.1
MLTVLPHFGLTGPPCANNGKGAHNTQQLMTVCCTSTGPKGIEDFLPSGVLLPWSHRGVSSSGRAGGRQVSQRVHLPAADAVGGPTLGKLAGRVRHPDRIPNCSREDVPPAQCAPPSRH